MKVEEVEQVQVVEQMEVEEQEEVEVVGHHHLCYGPAGRVVSAVFPPIFDEFQQQL